MRDEQQIMDLIINMVNSDERIRAMYMNGSRTNSNINIDKYSDYDVVFTVLETKSFLENKDWIYYFGKPLIIQEPYSADFTLEHDYTRLYTWLMLFDDGVRIDLQLKF